MPGWYMLYAANKVRKGKRLGMFDVMLLKRSRKREKLTKVARITVPEEKLDVLRDEFGPDKVRRALRRGDKGIEGLMNESKNLKMLEERKKKESLEALEKETEGQPEEYYVERGREFWKKLDRESEELPEIEKDMESDSFLRAALENVPEGVYEVIGTLPEGERQRFEEERERLRMLGVSLFDILNFVEWIDKEVDDFLEGQKLTKETLLGAFGRMESAFENLSFLAEMGFQGTKEWMRRPREQREEVVGAFRDAGTNMALLKEVAGEEKGSVLVEEIVTKAGEKELNAGPLMRAVAGSIYYLEKSVSEGRDFAMAYINEKKDEKRNERLRKRLKEISEKKMELHDKTAKKMQKDLHNLK